MAHVTSPLRLFRDCTLHKVLNWTGHVCHTPVSSLIRTVLPVHSNKGSKVRALRVSRICAAGTLHCIATYAITLMPCGPPTAAPTHSDLPAHPSEFTQCTVLICTALYCLHRTADIPVPRVTWAAAVGGHPGSGEGWQRRPRCVLRVCALCDMCVTLRPLIRLERAIIRF